MNRDYWNAVADTYEDEIFSVLEHDAGGLIPRTGGAIRGRRTGSRPTWVAGWAIVCPCWPAQFGRVHACDLSADCLEQARTPTATGPTSLSRCRPGPDPAVIPPVDFALCINVLITGSLAMRTRILRNLHRHLRDRRAYSDRGPIGGIGPAHQRPHDPVESAQRPSVGRGGEHRPAPHRIGAPGPPGAYHDRRRGHQSIT